MIVLIVGSMIMINHVKVDPRIAEDINKLIPILIKIESNGNPNAVGDNGKAIGILQIHRSYVTCVNNILGVKNYFAYEDAFNPGKAITMTKIYLGHYGTTKRLKMLPSMLDLAAIHNGGPNGWKKLSLAYRKKVIHEIVKSVKEGK